MKIPFNKACILGKELHYISQAVLNGEIKGGGGFSKACSNWLVENTGSLGALLTNSCTAALEMSALLCDIKPGDEIILPSYTFSSTANAFLLRGAIPVFCDIREDTLNIDEELIEGLITPKTKAICVVHYAGVACEMNKIMEIANQYKLFVIEDAAQAVKSTYYGRALGSIGHLGCFSFHETKNFSSGEGGALLINEKDFLERAEVIHEKGTNRSAFFRGEVDKYTWVDIGGSYLPSEIIAAFLYAQLEQAEIIFEKRLKIWEYYDMKLREMEKEGRFRCPVIPEYSQHNAHMYYIITNSKSDSRDLMDFLKSKDILAPFHYVPLHSSPHGKKFGYSEEGFSITNRVSDCLLRLPLYYDITEEEQNFVIDEIEAFYKK